MILSDSMLEGIQGEGGDSSERDPGLQEVLTESTSEAWIEEQGCPF